MIEEIPEFPTNESEFRNKYSAWVDKIAIFVLANRKTLTFEKRPHSVFTRVEKENGDVLWVEFWRANKWYSYMSSVSIYLLDEKNEIEYETKIHGQPSPKTMKHFYEKIEKPLL